jgi:hypothetical protein
MIFTLKILEYFKSNSQIKLACSMNIMYRGMQRQQNRLAANLDSANASAIRPALSRTLNTLTATVRVSYFRSTKYEYVPSGSVVAVRTGYATFLWYNLLYNNLSGLHSL